MTTVRDLIAAIVGGYHPNYVIADEVIAALTADASVRLELAKTLLPDDLLKDYAEFKAEARNFKTEWEAARQPVTIPRAEYDAYRAGMHAIYRYLAGDTSCNGGAEIMFEQVYAQARAAGIETGERK